jgi:hypothetical protein
MAAPAEVRPFIPDWEMLLLDLRGAAPEVLARASAALGGALRAQRAEAAPWEELESILKAALAELDVLGEEHPGQWLRAVWFLVLLLFHRREPEEYTAFKEHVEARARRLRLRLQEEVEEMGKTMAEVVAERARAEGRAEGRAGGLRHALEAILTERFGPVNPAIAAALDGADLDTLDDWLRSAVRADRLEEIGLPAH